MCNFVLKLKLVSTMQSIYNLSREELGQYFVDMGDKPYRSTQIFEWLYRFEVRSFSEMTNQKKSIIAKLEEDFDLDLLTLKERQISSDEACIDYQLYVVGNRKVHQGSDTDLNVLTTNLTLRLTTLSIVSFMI